MWIRKSETALHTEARVEKIRRAGLTGCGLLLAGFLYLTFPRWAHGEDAGWTPPGWRLMAGGFVLTYGSAVWLHLRPRDKTRVVVCSRCQHQFLDNGKDHCECGGELVNLNEMRWSDVG